ncbi:HET-domain-containing protein [Melanomma pulvis-pyrius CBS 109.77]|uniref:HET-domain-containing protein n=1 Tax=Melanomma pulvis-pyrius CBS 109.77 TaxID=1314802 RepID=A0A6A6XLP8_9PLEO|nr:HET-domain-containing protein [Melanomma pulvis-pyrius CBS 109.77]
MCDTGKSCNSDSEPLTTHPSCHLRLPYRYTRLEDGHIRLLDLSPGPPESPLMCSLRVTDLMKMVNVVNTIDCQLRGRYEALSYVWGDPKVTEEICCAGQSLFITVNLGDALRRLRYIDKVRTLWADALCINQNDNKEKNAQIRLMGLIYWKARLVNIWLGHETEENIKLRSDVAVSLIQATADLDNGTDIADTIARRFRPLGSEVILDHDDVHFEWEAARLLFNRPWFRRAWTVQELGLACDAVFYCGNAYFSLLQLKLFKRFLRGTGSSFSSFYCLDTGSYGLAENYYNSTRGNMRLEYGSDPKMAETFLQVLERARTLECTEPRDAIYAFLGHPSAFKSQLLDDGPYLWYTSNFLSGATTLIEPDYSADNTVGNLYFELAITAIYKLEIGPELFSHIIHDEKTIEWGFPSWVPRWNIDDEARAFYIDPTIYYSASGGLSHTLFDVVMEEKADSTTKLRLKAQNFDSINFRYTLPDASMFTVLKNPFITFVSDIPQCILNPIEDLYTEYTAFRSTLPMTSWEHNNVMSFVVTLTAGLSQHSDHEKFIVEDPETHFVNFCAYRREKAAIWGPVLAADEREHLNIYEGSADHFFDDLTIVAGRRAFFFTEKGYIGLGPRIMRDGDQVWLPLGAKMPCVLRPWGDGTYKILGLAYVHDIMEGEAVAGREEDDFEVITLR